MKLAKFLMVVAAILLVGSVAIGTLGPQEMSLGDAITRLDRTSLATVEAYVRHHLSAWVWKGPLMAIIGRPIWLVPAALGLICAGAAATAASVPAANNSRRRRS